MVPPGPKNGRVASPEASCRGEARWSSRASHREDLSAESIAANTTCFPSGEMSYRVTRNPGVWVPTPPAFAPASLPGWGRVTPWVMRSQSQFRLGPPPALDSNLYVMDVNEVKNIGAQNSLVRIGPETDVAMWWGSSATIIWNPIASQVAAAKKLSIS